MIAVLALLCAVAGCGGSHRAPASAAAVSVSRAPQLGDRDGDNRGSSYYDGDDEDMRRFGHRAGAADARAIAALVRSYYAAAAAASSECACGLLFFALAESLPEMYGRPPGPPYLEGADTCRAVLARVFRRFHAELRMAPTVTLVRVEGDRARALLGWPLLPAASIEARREGNRWRLDQALAVELP